MSPDIRNSLLNLSTLADRILTATGFRPTYIEVTERFAARLEEEGFIPEFDCVLPYGGCWKWLLHDGLAIVSTLGLDDDTIVA